jgi:hypothetical protein
MEREESSWIPERSKNFMIVYVVTGLPSAPWSDENKSNHSQDTEYFEAWNVIKTYTCYPGWAFNTRILGTRLSKPVRNRIKLKLYTTDSPFIRKNAGAVDPNRQIPAKSP